MTHTLKHEKKKKGKHDKSTIKFSENIQISQYEGIIPQHRAS